MRTRRERERRMSTVAKAVVEFGKKHKLRRVKHAANIFEYEDGRRAHTGGVLGWGKPPCRVCLVGASWAAQLAGVITKEEDARLCGRLRRLMETERNDKLDKLRTVRSTKALWETILEAGGVR